MWAALVLVSQLERGQNSLAGDWVAIATNGVRVKETLHLRSDGGLTGSVVFTEKAWSKQNERFAGSYRIASVKLPDGKGHEAPQETLTIVWDGKGRNSGPAKRFLLYRTVPAFTDILTTTFAPVGQEARVYSKLYGKKYTPPWK
jgi:hypothetical protein